MAVKGVFASDQNIVGTKKGDFSSALLRVNPTGSAPMLALTAGMQSKGAMDTVITWFEENHLSGNVNVTNNAGSGTSIVVDDVTQIVSGAIMLVGSTGEYIFVESVTDSTSTLTVTRGLGGSTITAINGSVTPVPIQRISTAHEEGSSKPTAVANLGYPRFNYMQILRNAWDATGTAKAVEFHTGNVVAKNRQDAAMYHAEDIERAIMWGKKAIGTLNSKPFRLMDGLVNQITTNVATQAGAGGNTSWDEIDAFLQTVFERNIKGKPNERIAFCGNTVLRVLNEIAIANGQIQIYPGQTEFGMKVNKWITPFGDISLLTHPLMNEDPVYWSKEMYVFHPGAIRTRYLRKTNHDAYDSNGTRNGVDADYGIFTTEMSIEYAAELTGGKYTGIDTSA